MRHVKPTRHMRRLGYVVAAAAALSAMTPEAMAEDSLKIAVARRGAWDTAAPDLGQRAGIFKKHGLTLDLTYPRAEETIEPAVISGSADVGLGVGIVDVLRAYATEECPDTDHRRKHDRLRQLLVCGGDVADQDGQGHQRQDHRLFEGRCVQPI